MSLMRWEPGYQLGRDDMDDTHREFIDLVNAADESPDDEAFKAAFHALVQHTRAHFEHENRLMEESGFYALHVHVGEHHRVMRQMDQVNERVQLGMLKLGREVLAGMPSWFAQHAATMDSALAAHLKAKALEV
ncbi:MAG: bacteriohemerythrin [Gammaproteobacteria bacterium]